VKELDSLLGGGRDFIRTRNNEFTGFAINMEVNPQAPDIMVVGKGKRRQKKCDKFVNSCISIPLYLKIKPDNWELQGEYTLSRFSREKDVILAYQNNSPIEDIYGILFLKPIDS
jgi:hypothetical protein